MPGARIEIVDLRKSFEHEGRRIDVLRGVNLQVAPGDLLAVEGASGVGKSTFLHVVGTLDVPTSGSVRFDGRDLTRLDRAELCAFRNQAIGFMFQFHHLLAGFTALENAAMPARIAGRGGEQAYADARLLLERVGLTRRLTHRPGELSGGEQSRVALARALMLKPRLLLADEPTGNLDRKTGEQIHQLLVELNRDEGLTAIIVTHNPMLARRMPRRVHMIDGVIEGAA